MKRATIAELISLLFAALFLYAGVSKLMEYSIFKEQLSESPLLSSIANLLAWGLPTLEIIIGLMLLVARLRLPALYIALALMIMFTAYIGYFLAFSKEIPCSCGGLIEEMSWTGHIVFNSCFIALGIIGTIMERGISRHLGF